MSEGKPFAAPAEGPPAKKNSAAAAAEADIVAELTRSLVLLPGDRVTCVRVYGDFYRCNWWAPGEQTDAGPMIEGLRASTYRIRKSQFLRVTTAEGRVVVHDATRTVAAD